MKRSIADRVREKGYRVETFDGQTFKVYEAHENVFIFHGNYTKSEMRGEFDV